MKFSILSILSDICSYVICSWTRNFLLFLFFHRSWKLKHYGLSCTLNIIVSRAHLNITSLRLSLIFTYSISIQYLLSHFSLSQKFFVLGIIILWARTFFFSFGGIASCYLESYLRLSCLQIITSRSRHLSFLWWSPSWSWKSSIE